MYCESGLTRAGRQGWRNRSRVIRHAAKVASIFPDSGIHMSSQLAAARRPHHSAGCLLSRRVSLQVTSRLRPSQSRQAALLLSYVYRIKTTSVTLHQRLQLSEHLITQEETRAMRNNPWEHGRDRGPPRSYVQYLAEDFRDGHGHHPGANQKEASTGNVGVDMIFRTALHLGGD